MRAKDVNLFEALNDLALRSIAPAASKLAAEERAREITPKQEPAPFPPEVLTRARRLHLAQLTIAEVHAAGWLLIPTPNGVRYDPTAMAGNVNAAVQKAVKVLRDEIKACLAYEGVA